VTSDTLVTLTGCPVCDGPARRHRYTKFDLPLVQCTSCGLMYANPRLPPDAIWKRYSPDYFWKEYMPSLGVPDGRYDLAYFDARHAAMLKLIARDAPSPGRLIEIGTGAGFFLKAAERAGWQVAGIEVSDEAVSFATERLTLDVRRESAETMTFPPGSFDVAVMLEVVEHLLDPLSSLRRVRAALRSGGLLVLTTPNVDALTRLALGSSWAVLSPAEHLYNFSADTLARLLARAGFSNVRIVRDYDGFGVFETMNARCTHARSSPRNRAYAILVSTIGWLIFRHVQRAGRADTLLVLASATS